MSRVLVVDDDSTIIDVVSRYLTLSGHDVEGVLDGVEALRVARARPPDIVVLDLMLPGMSGLDVCRQLHRIAPIPVIMLTALGEEADRVAGLEIGADDYLTKPFSPKELTLRVDAVLRRVGQPIARSRAAGLVDDDLVVDPAAHQATRAGEVLSLTTREYDLLVFLMRHPREAFSREQLLEQVWDWTFGDLSTVTVHVRRLREKIESDPANPRRIVTVWGVGYRYEPSEPTP